MVWGMICVVSAGKQTSRLNSFEIVEVEKDLMCIRSYLSNRHSGWSGTCLIIKGLFFCARGIIYLKPVHFFMLLIFAWAEWMLLCVFLSNWSWFTGNKYVMVLRGNSKYLWHRIIFCVNTKRLLLLLLFSEVCLISSSCRSTISTFYSAPVCAIF